MQAFIDIFGPCTTTFHLSGILLWSTMYLSDYSAFDDSVSSDGVT